MVNVSTSEQLQTSGDPTVTGQTRVATIECRLSLF